MSSKQAREIAELWRAVEALRSERVNIIEAPVTSADPATSTFAVTVPNQQDGSTQALAGIEAPQQFLPAVGDLARMAVSGNQPMYLPGGLAANSVGAREIVPGSIPPEALSFDVETIGGGTTVHYGELTPDPAGVVTGDLWVAVVNPGPPVQHETRRWNGAAWEQVYNQRVTQALLDAAAAQSAANAAGVDAIAAQAAADAALTDAATAQTTADSKTATFSQPTAPPTTGRTVGDEWIDTDDGNRRYVWNGNAWASVPLGSSGISATARDLGAITTYKQATAPASGMIAGDYWLDSDDGNKAYRYSGTAWELVQDASIQTALNNAATAQATADGKVRIFPQTTAPTGLVAGDVGDMWIDTDDANRVYTWSGTAWVARLLGNNAIQPESLVASNVIATGTVTAALLESLMVLATIIVAGNAQGDHARMTPTGFRVYRADPDGSTTPEEVVRMGTDTNDYFAIINSAGALAASVDDTGVASYAGLFTPWISLNGADLAARLAELPTGEVARFSGKRGTDLQFWDRVGVVEVGSLLHKGRAYRIDWRAAYKVSVANNEVRFKLHHTFGTDGDTTTEPAAPTISSPQIATFYFTGNIASRWFQAQGSMQYYPTTTTRRRVLLTVERGVPDTLDNAFIIGAETVELMITDLGPASVVSGQFTTAGGIDRGVSTTPPPPSSTSQQYSVDLAPAGFHSWRGNGTQRTDYNGIVQGWDPSGYNGDGGGYWWFNLPSITGTVDHVELYCYTDHWYYNSGGTAIFNIIPYPATSSYDANKLRTDWHVTGYPKPGGKTVTLPADWWPQFKDTPPSGARAFAITVGNSGGTNLIHYGKFQGPSARLRIWYTQ